MSADSLAWSIKHLLEYGDTSVFPKAFEFQAIEYCRDEVIKHLSKQDICQWLTRTTRKCLVPKQRYGFRVITQLDPLDMLFYNALCLEVGEEIEKRRLPIAQKVTFSNRFSPDNDDFRFFDKEMNYAAFTEHCKELAKEHSHVVVTDIADFYYRIYFHFLENALRSAVKTHPAHATAILRLVKSWNQNVSYGIPVGSNPSRLLAELVLDDIDRALLAEGIVFTRWVDDYRIFCRSSEEAHKLLAKVAEILYNSQGLTLQSHKTDILPSERFVDVILEPESIKEFNSLAERFSEIVGGLGLDNPYGPIDYDTLPPEIQEEINALNLEALLEEQLNAEEIDIRLTRFLIGRMGQLQRKDIVWNLLKQTSRLYPVFSDIIQYIAQIGQLLDSAARQEIGCLLLEKLDNSVVSQLEFHKMYIMSLFAGSVEWGNIDKLARYYSLPESGEWFRRALLLALGKSKQYQWLRTRKNIIGQFTEWEKRAFIYAASSFPKDERNNWYAAIKPNLDELGRYVAIWAKANPI